MLGVLGVLALTIYVLHAANHLRLGTAHDLLWMCNLATAVLAIGCLARNATLVGMPMLWLSIGTPLWLMDLLHGGEVLATGILTHVGGLAISVMAVIKLGMPRGTWYRATVVLGVVMALSRIATPREANVNLVFSVRTGWDAYFGSHLVYLAMLLAIGAAGAFAVERVVVRITASSA